MHLSDRTPAFAPLALVVLCFVSQTGFTQPKNQIVATIPIGQQSTNLVVSPDSKFVYVANFSADGSSGIVQVIDTSSNTITGTINLGTNSFPNALTITPNGRTLYVTQFDGPHVWVIDTATQQITTTLTLGSPKGLTVSPDGTVLYVCDFSGGTVAVIDTATNQITNTIQVGHSSGHRPWDVVFTSDGSTAFVAAKPNSRAGDRTAKAHGWIAIIDTTQQIKNSSIVLTHGRGITSIPMEVFDPNSNQLFYSQERSIKVISASSGRVVRGMAQNFFHGLAVITPDGQYLYMKSDMGGGRIRGVTTIEASSGNVVGQPIPFSNPFVLVIAPNGKFAYVAGELSNDSPGGIFVVDISPQ